MFKLDFSVVLADSSNQRGVDFTVVVLLVSEDLVIIDSPFVLGHYFIELFALFKSLHLLSQILNILRILPSFFMFYLFFIFIDLLCFLIKTTDEVLLFC